MASVVAQSYADALFSIALEEEKLDLYKEQLCNLQKQLQEHPDFMRILTHPKIAKDEKKDVLESVFGKDIEHTVCNFLKLLIDKGRFQNLSDITKEFVKRYNKENNIEVAIITSAKALQDDEISRLKTMLEQKLAKKVEMRFHIDEDVIAGIRIKIGDQVLDNTAKNRMDALKSLVQNADLSERLGDANELEARRD